MKDNIIDPKPYPTPAIPLSPVISQESLKLGTPHNCEIQSVLSAPSLLHVTSGRAAISLALEYAEITQGDEVLIPAFHCESMISPVKWRKATSIFYQINIDTTIDIRDIESRITSNSKVILATHYFGFLQDLQPLRELCDKHNLLLIEDCAHAFFGSINGRSVGSWGDYIIASSMKFFPVYDGGILASRTHSIDNIKLRKPPLIVQIKSLINIIEKSVRYKRLGLPGRIISYLFCLKDACWKLIKTSKAVRSTGPASSEGAYSLDEKWIHILATYPSRKLIKNSNFKRIADLRRKNYETLDLALKNLPDSRPLYSKMPHNCIPLVYPIFIKSPELHFSKLKRMGVPIWRFGEFLDESIDFEHYPNSIVLSDHIFQLPCHQELQDNEIKWMIDCITRSLNEQH